MTDLMGGGGILEPGGGPGAQRIVSLLPAATEIVAALGALDRLVAVTHECDYPPAVQTLPRVTASAIPSALTARGIDDAVRRAASTGSPLFTVLAGRIASLRPDLLLTQAICEVCAVHEGDVRALAADLPGTPAVLTLGASTFDDVFASVQTVAAALALEANGRALTDHLRERLRRVHDTLKAARAPRPRVLVIEWTDPLYTAGHWVPELVRRAGGVDVAAEPGEHSRIRTHDELAGLAPDVVVFAPCGYGVDAATAEARLSLARAEWQWARTASCWAIDANAFTSRPGPRVCDGVETLAQIFNPALFPPVNPGSAFLVLPAEGGREGRDRSPANAPAPPSSTLPC
jgi:iron complex transport system substrate-binding protein